ncbi:hypothetical protein T4E_4282 [Trichinella pseudospiralis]|uniref:Patched domain-containing protein 3 n=1 Tax=Trichinella pseudospiralis TaxID=6337 RepID=A0A0V0XQZ6_TRIPS|nr:hypothetical protein T4E_4282 [Trichinella pseudospiralis]
MSIFLRNSFFNYAKSSSSLPGTEIVSNWRHLPDGSPVYARAWRPSCLPGACILLLVCLFLTGLKRRRRCVDSLPLFLFIIVPSSLFTAFKARCCIFTITDIDHRSDHPSDKDHEQASSPQTGEKCLDYLERLFQRHGELVGRHPAVFLIGPLLVAGLLSVGVVNVQMADDMRELYTPPGSVSLDEYRQHSQFLSCLLYTSRCV